MTRYVVTASANDSLPHITNCTTDNRLHAGFTPSSRRASFLIITPAYQKFIDTRKQFKGCQYKSSDFQTKRSGASSHQNKPNVVIRLLCICVTIKQSMTAIRLLSNPACSTNGCAPLQHRFFLAVVAFALVLIIVVPNVCVFGVRSPASLGG